MTIMSIVQVVRLFEPDDVSGFIERNRPMLEALKPEEKRAVWDGLKLLKARAM